MSNTTTALVLYLVMSGIFFLANIAIADLNPTGTQFYDPKGNVLCQYDQAGCASNTNYTLTGNSPVNFLPSADASISATTGNIFTDSFTAFKNWLLDATGIRYLVSFIAGPYSILTSIGLPTPISFVLSAIWFGTGIYFLLAFALGRQD